MEREKKVFESESLPPVFITSKQGVLTMSTQLQLLIAVPMVLTAVLKISGALFRARNGSKSSLSRFPKRCSWRMVLPLAALAGWLGSETAKAGMIWGTPKGISADSDVNTTGTLVVAFNFGGNAVAETTVNGVKFQTFNLEGKSSMTKANMSMATSDGSKFIASDSWGSTFKPFAGLSGAYQTLLKSGVGTASPANCTLTMSALTPGHQYLFEWWSNNSDTPTNVYTNATDKYNVLLGSNVSQNGLGQFVTGTFVAAESGAERVEFDFSKPNSFISGFELRDEGVASPEPSSVALLCTGVLGLFGYVWHRGCGKRRRSRDGSTAAANA
jgi:hypothetical protein